LTDSDLQNTPTNISLIKRIALAAILLIVIILFGLSGWYYSYVFRSGPVTIADSVVVSIPKGTSVEKIGGILAEARVISADIRFLLLAKFSGYANRLQAGEFSLKTGQKPGDVLKTLVTAKSVQYSITIPEGLRASEIAAVFSTGGWCDPQTFSNLIQDKEFIAGLGYENLTSLEGYLYPDTYLLTKDYKGAEKIITMMVRRFSRVWTDLAKKQDKDVNREKTVTLASIVEKETAAPHERPLIAGVFLNRLRLGMRLQSDPTVVYGIESFSGKITKTHLKTPTPYNTYTNHGLPVGPICNPGIEALSAVLDPVSTNKLYFVSKNDGTHQFSATLAEHNRAVQKYQRKKTGKKGK
jgi:UPF0755 protein